MDTWDVVAFDVDHYLNALGLTRQSPSAEYLAELHQRHVETFPFTSLNVLLGSHPGVEPATVFEQLVTRRLGGYCLEHSQLFAGVLEQLGFEIERHLGRVRDTSNTRSHMTVLATVAGDTFFCDPGFGFSITRPLPLRDGATRHQGGRVFSLKRQDDMWWLYRDGEPQHGTDDLLAQPIDVATAHAYLQIGFGPFNSTLMAMRHTASGHVTITADRKTVRAHDLPTTLHELTPDETIAELEELGLAMDEQHRSKLRRHLLEHAGHNR